MDARLNDDPPHTVPLYSPYPVVDSAELDPVPHRLFRRPRRAIHEIPRQPPGTVLVFQLGDSYDVVSGRSLRLDSDLVVDAVAVAVVSIQHTLREAVAYLPTADPRACVTVRARFHCWVTDPVLVVESGCWNVEPLLTDHIVADRRLRFLAQACDLDHAWSAFHRNASARLFAYHDLHPLIVPGLTVRLVDAAIELQRLATVPRARPSVDVEWSGPEPPGEGDGTHDVDGMRDGNPAFVPDNYTWGKSDD
jgi:hypothetical protein